MKHLLPLCLPLLILPLAAHSAFAQNQAYPGTLTLDDLCPYHDASTGFNYGYAMQVTYGNPMTVWGAPTHATGIGQWLTNGSVLQFSNFEPEDNTTKLALMFSLSNNKLQMTGFSDMDGTTSGHVITTFTKNQSDVNTGYMVKSDQKSDSWYNNGFQSLRYRSPAQLRHQPDETLKRNRFPGWSPHLLSVQQCRPQPSGLSKHILLLRGHLPDSLHSPRHAVLYARRHGQLRHPMHFRH